MLTSAGRKRGSVLPLLVKALVLQVGPVPVAPLVPVGTPVGGDLRPVVHLRPLTWQTGRREVLAREL